MAYTRPWTAQEERYLRREYAGDRRQVQRVARALHRTAKAILERWKRIGRCATRARKYAEGIHGLLPDGVTLHDPAGTFCGVCGAPCTFETIDGRCVERCPCGVRFVGTRTP